MQIIALQDGLCCFLNSACNFSIADPDFFLNCVSDKASSASAFANRLATQHSSAVGCPIEIRSAKAQPIHLRLSKGRPTDELNERPLEGPISTASSCYTVIRNRTLHLQATKYVVLTLR